MTEQAQSTAIRPRIVRRYYFGVTSHVELECGHHKDEREKWAGADVMRGEVSRCFDCEMVAAGLMPSLEQLAAFRREHGAT
ncbi:TPA: hypothetical protein L6A81_12555 [Pseudomonas aeruginosa]|nr:hypothetical protein [Pseudomonas aeruginosa]